MKTTLIALFCLFLAGCTMFTPETPGETIASGYVTITRLTKATTSALDAGFLKSDQAREAHTLLTNAKGAFEDAAVALIEPDGDPTVSLTTAKDALKLVIAILGPYADE